MTIPRVGNLRLILVLVASLLAALTVAWSPPTARAGESLDGDPFWDADLDYSGLGNVRLGAKFRFGPGDDRLETGLFSLLPDGIPDDLYFEDPAGIEPPPPPCLAASSTVVRCPLQNLVGLYVELASGDDDVRSNDAGFGAGLGFGSSRWVFDLGAGNDRFFGDGEDDITMGGPGDDLMRTGGGRDRLLGGRGDDRLFGDADPDFFLGGPGDDFARGGGGNDRGRGGPGNDDFQD